MLRTWITLILSGSLGCSLPKAERDLPAERHWAPAEDARGRPADPGGSLSASAIEPLPLQVDVDPQKAALGERLFVDTRLSGDGRVACVHCHSLSHGGANPEPRAWLPGRKRAVAVNVPSVFNVAFDFRYAWDGRFKTLEEQIEFAMGSAAAMDGSFALALQHLQRAEDAELRRDFASCYEEGLTERSLRDALAAFCRSAITPNARFDRFLRGSAALSEAELRGYETFRDYGCISCHQGVNVGGNMFQRFGLMRPYFPEAQPASAADAGRFNVTHDEQDRYVFRVPSLRNVALTAPYFHDGSASTLEEAVIIMARHQLGRELSGGQVQDIAAFLRTLTGEYRGKPL